MPFPTPRRVGPGALYFSPWAAAVAAVAASLFLPNLAARLGWYVLAASIPLFGLPHGSADWWVMRLAARGQWNWRTQARCAAVYVAASLLTLGLWRVLPATALVGFLGLTAWHFGSAEASVLMPGRPTFRDGAWWMFAAGRGLLVVCLSLAFRPAETLVTLGPFAALGGNVETALGGLLRAALPLVWTGAILQTLAIRLDARSPDHGASPHRLAYNVIETCLLLLLFRAAPPLLAFACYWVAFHAWRHIGRLEWIVQPEDARMPWGRMLLDFHRRTLPLTLLALPGIGLIFAAWPALGQGAQPTVVAYLILLSVLTVPHAGVIGWLDKTKAKVKMQKVEVETENSDAGKESSLRSG